MADVGAQTDPEGLPSGRFVLIRDISKALNGEDFLYYSPSGGKPKFVKGTPVRTWNYYFLLFDNCEKFGLPHSQGKGWVKELPWLIDFLSMMKNTLKIIECWLAEKDPGVPNITPGEAGF